MSEDLLTHFLTRYNAFLADKLSTDIDQIKKISSTFLSTYEAPVITKPSVSAPVSTSKSTGICTYLLRSGKNKGQPCGTKEKASGSSRCKTHEGKEEEKSTETPSKSTSVAKKEPIKEEVANETSDEGEDSACETVKPTKVSRSSKSKRVAQLQKMEQQEVVKTIQTRRCDVPITKSPFGNYVHTGTCLAWDRETSSVKGRELPNGQVVPLTENDIQLCIANGWKYKSDFRINKPQLDADDDSKFYEEDVETSEEEDDM